MHRLYTVFADAYVSLNDSQMHYFICNCCVLDTLSGAERFAIIGERVTREQTLRSITLGL
jgi:hypothetical protein